MIYDFIKRVMDIVLAVFLGIIFSPIIVLAAIIIKLTSPGPILAQTPMRVGRNSKLFKLYKFRSMIENAHELLTEDPRFAKLYEQYKRSSFKLQHDPRITPFGQFIRKHSLDELPQLFNVILGDMSLVGPRAYYKDELENQQKRYPETEELVREVLSVKPGITGYWQVSGRSQINFDKRIAMDAHYACSKSFWLDALIILKTPWVMLTGKGAI